MIQNKIQIDEKDFEFIKKASKTLSYKSLSHYCGKRSRPKCGKTEKN